MKWTADRTLLRRAWLPAAVAVLVLLLAVELHRLWQVVRFNAAVDAPPLPVGQAPVPVSRQEPGLVLFVHGHAAARDGRLQEALSLYKDAARDRYTTVAAHYNSGNIYLRDALELASRSQLQQMPQSVELAKQQFRDALRADPGHWPSKYNLERALWLAPELPDEDKNLTRPEESERAVTTMRGFTIGLP